ncbi:transaldolase [Pleionea litopenaei]|uniref:Transaldolase n=1 Tax=Pleionea litopenaei TaxID=3070815 RepID=A0AA51RXD3_9GAMM|nr:transaldolase [Pleionea sp. HL-JVS1]WMS89204.1 transaldolase [Pleionea sp. HL-JVS1]
MNQLNQLKQYTKVVADTGDFTAIEAYQPEDTTTNPSLLLKAAAQADYQIDIAEAIEFAREQSSDEQQQVQDACDMFAVKIGKRLLNQIPGFNSTEVDARLSFSKQATIDKAHRIIQLYKKLEVDPSRVLIKIASTWEGIQAARELEKQGIRCNLTLLFHFVQARACAEAGAFLISPFVGRIYDWYKNDQNLEDIAIENDPGVESVSRIYHYYKQHQHHTIVMGASFRKVEQVLALAGCDRLTISPALLAQLTEQTSTVQRKLEFTGAFKAQPEPLSEAEFRWQMNQDAMATEKTAEGIRKFAEDQIRLETIIREQLIKS